MAKIACEHEEKHVRSAQRAKEGILTTADIEQICQIFRILSDPTRMKIVLALLEGEMCVYHLAEVCDATVSGVSHQLRILRDNKVVRAKRYGKNVEYAIADEHVHEIVKMGIKHTTCAREF